MGGRGKRKQLAGLPASHPPIHPSSFIQTKNSSMCFMDLCFLDVGPGSRAFTCARESFSGENSCSSPSALRWWFSFPASHSKANFFFFFGLFSCECHTKQGGKNGCWLTSRNACNIGCYHGKAVSTWLLCCLPTATSLSASCSNPNICIFCALSLLKMETRQIISMLTCAHLLSSGNHLQVCCFTLTMLSFACHWR